MATTMEQQLLDQTRAVMLLV